MGLLARSWSNALGSIIQRIRGAKLISYEGDKLDYVDSSEDELDFIKNIFKLSDVSIKIHTILS